MGPLHTHHVNQLSLLSRNLWSDQISKECARYSNVHFTTPTHPLEQTRHRENRASVKSSELIYHEGNKTHLSVTAARWMVSSQAMALTAWRIDRVYQLTAEWRTSVSQLMNEAVKIATQLKLLARAAVQTVQGQASACGKWQQGDPYKCRRSTPRGHKTSPAYINTTQ